MCDTSSAAALVSVGFWPHLQNRTPCLAFPSRPLPPLSLLQLESSARVYFHGWGAKTALSLFWLPCCSQRRRCGGLRTGAVPQGPRVCRWAAGGFFGRASGYMVRLKRGVKVAPGGWALASRSSDGNPPLCFLRS